MPMTGSSELLVRFAPGTPEAMVASAAPHHSVAEGHFAGDISPRLGRLASAVGERGEIGRAYPGRHRASRHPYSPLTGISEAERKLGFDRTMRMRLRDPLAAKRLADLLVDTGVAEAVEPILTVTTAPLLPAEPVPLASDLPGSWAKRAVRGDEALSIEPGDPDVVVAVLDTGIDATHPEFLDKLLPGWDFVDLPPGDPSLFGHDSDPGSDTADQAGHGTHVAGTVGAWGLGMPSGFGGRCRILPVRVLGTAIERGHRVGIGQVPDIDAGIKFAVDQGVDVINMSLGLRGDAGAEPPHTRTIEYARLHNVAVVAAAGNDGTPGLLYPAALPGVITVGAIDELGHVASFTSTGQFMDLAAPGTSIYSADMGGCYRYRSGTSHAAPIVAGTAALLIALAHRHGMQLPESVTRRILRETADRRDRRFEDAASGRGTLNAQDAVIFCSRLIRDEVRHPREQRLMFPQPAAAQVMQPS